VLAADEVRVWSVVLEIHDGEDEDEDIADIKKSSVFECIKFVVCEIEVGTDIPICQLPSFQSGFMSLPETKDPKMPFADFRTRLQPNNRGILETEFPLLIVRQISIPLLLFKDSNGG
jgi:hypothetical protein